MEVYNIAHFPPSSKDNKEKLYPISGGMAEIGHPQCMPIISLIQEVEI
jgi:hypothetical protein